MNNAPKGTTRNKAREREQAAEEHSNTLRTSRKKSSALT